MRCEKSIQTRTSRPWQKSQPLQQPLTSRMASISSVRVVLLLFAAALVPCSNEKKNTRSSLLKKVRGPTRSLLHHLQGLLGSNPPPSFLLSLCLIPLGVVMFDFLVCVSYVCGENFKLTDLGRPKSTEDLIELHTTCLLCSCSVMRYYFVKRWKTFPSHRGTKI